MPLMSVNWRRTYLMSCSWTCWMTLVTLSFHAASLKFLMFFHLSVKLFYPFNLYLFKHKYL